MFQCRAIYFLVAAISAITPAAGQNSSRTHERSSPQVTTVIENRFLSREPKVQKAGDKALPGRQVMSRETRATQFRARIAGASKGGRTRTAAASAVGPFPGVEMRDSLPAGQIPVAVATGDFNKDGSMDFVAANGWTSDLWMYFGKGDGTFELPRIIPLTKGLSPIYMVAADLRGNGNLDLIVAEFDTSTIGVLLGKGDGTFQYEKTYLLPQPPAALVVDDFNHDGKMDIASVMYTVSTTSLAVDYIAMLPGTGTGTLGTPVITTNSGFYGSAWNIAAGDVNNDGKPDLLITGPDLDNSTLYLNSGAGHFTLGRTIIENGPFNVELDGRLADVDEDGCLDGVIADANNYVWVRKGSCDGNFGEPSQWPMGDSNSAVRLADMNGDGHLDIVTTAIPATDPIYGFVAGNTLSVALGDGRGGFTNGRNYKGNGESYSLSLADFNGDGKFDVVTSNTETDTATVYQNDGTGNFGFPQGLWVGVPGIGVINAPVSPLSFADVNGDGKPDIELLDEGDGGKYIVTVLLNDGSGKFMGPISSDANIDIVANWIGDHRLGDFRGIGRLDLVAVGLSSAYGGHPFVLFMPGNGDGSFGAPTLTTMAGASGAMTVGDFNRDGHLDFVAVDSANGTANKSASVFLGNGDGAFRSGGSSSVADSAEDVLRVFAGDFNRDGKLDVLLFDSGNGYWTTKSNVDVFLGNGDGTLQSGRSLIGSFQPMTATNLNGDQWPDLLRYDFFWPDGTTQTLGPARFTLYLDQSNGTFQQASSYAPYAGIPRSGRSYLQNGDPSATSMGTDMDGDGKVDALAFQVSQSAFAPYLQVLKGNGDGTLTPTYDIFPFSLHGSFPEFARDLTGDGKADLVELDAGTSSLHVFRSAPAPSFQMVLEDEQVQGNSGCGWIFPNIPSSSDRMLTLSSTVSGVILPSSVTVGAGSLGQKFCYTLAADFDWRKVFDVRAGSGAETFVTYASRSYVAGFNVELAPNTDQVIYPNQNTNPVTVTLTSAEGYSSTSHLRCEGLWPGASCTFGSSTLSVSPSSPATTTVVVNSGNNQDYGGGTVQVVAEDAIYSKRASFVVRVQPLIVNALAVRSTSPGSGIAAVMIVGIPPYSPSCSGLPSGASCSFSGEQLPYPSDTDLALTVTVKSGLAVGTYPFKVTVKSGPASTTTDTTLSVIPTPDLVLHAPPASMDWAPPGGSMMSWIGLEGINNLRETVTVSCAVDFAGTCTGTSTFVSGNTTVPLTIIVPEGVAPGAYSLAVTATSSSLTRKATFSFYVAEYTGTISMTSVVLQRGNSGSTVATINVTDGFSGVLDFACAGSALVTCHFNPSRVSPTAPEPQTVTITMTASPSASLAPASPIFRSSLWWLATMVPMFTVWIPRRRTSRLATVGVIVLGAATMIISACGGGSNSPGGGGGSNHYSITVNAIATGTGTSRSIGSVNVTVSH